MPNNNMRQRERGGRETERQRERQRQREHLPIIRLGILKRQNLVQKNCTIYNIFKNLSANYLFIQILISNQFHRTRHSDKIQHIILHQTSLFQK